MRQETLHITAIPAFNDNYLWLITHPHQAQAYIVDPGDGVVVEHVLRQQQLTLAGILITHQHHDHTQGIAHLMARYHTEEHPVPIYGPASDAIPQITHQVKQQDCIRLFNDYSISVLETPGHTPEHLSYFALDGFASPVLFCGDTLFAAGCGRLLGGTAEQLYNSLCTFQDLPDNTAIYCAHEYTLANLAFAQAVEPNNLAIKKRIAEEATQRQQDIPTIPSLLATEKATNPFLRVHVPHVQAAVAAHWDQRDTCDRTVFAGLRRWKDKF
jgi:hydroxyacylglutathione hydrolase